MWNHLPPEAQTDNWVKLFKGVIHQLFQQYMGPYISQRIEIDNSCPLGKSEHQLLKLSIQLDFLFDRSICFKTVVDFSKADFDGLRDHFSNYNDWALLINLDINEGWNLIKNRICDGMIKFIPRVTLKNNK